MSTEARSTGPNPQVLTIRKQPAKHPGRRAQTKKGELEHKSFEADALHEFHRYTNPDQVKEDCKLEHECYACGVLTESGVLGKVLSTTGITIPEFVCVCVLRGIPVHFFI